jgi:uncharacterized Tic20 family protein
MSSVQEPTRDGPSDQIMDVKPAGSVTSPTPDELQWGQLCHFMGVMGFLGPLIFWLIKKDTSKYIDAQGKSALNFHLSVLIVFAVCAATFILIPIAILVNVYSLVMSIMAGMKVKDGEIYKYPYTFKLIK